MTRPRKPKPKAPGRNVTEAERHTVRLMLRVPPETLGELDALRGEATRSETVARLVRAAKG